jgi:hypothetical protein
MTDEQINVAIAEACGWVDRGSFNESRPEDHKFKRRIGNTENYEWRWQHEFNYCRDLNAMHEAEKLLDYQQAEDFGDMMYNLCADENSEQDNPFPWRFAVIHATARQRAEAFLRTLGKWEEDK